jgi:hypothetical protein
VTVNDRIVLTAWRALRGDVPVATASGFCLKVVRQVLEAALGMRDGQFYDEHVHEWVQPSGYDRSFGHWARDAERSLRHAGMAIQPAEVLPGDLLFKYDAAEVSEALWRKYFPGRPYEPGVHVGHVRILLTPDVVFENIRPSYRPSAYLRRGNLSLTPFEDFPAVTTYIRYRGC